MYFKAIGDVSALKTLLLPPSIDMTDIITYIKHVNFKATLFQNFTLALKSFWWYINF